MDKLKSVWPRLNKLNKLKILLKISSLNNQNNNKRRKSKKNLKSKKRKRIKRKLNSLKSQRSKKNKHKRKSHNKKVQNKSILNSSLKLISESVKSLNAGNIHNHKTFIARRLTLENKSEILLRDYKSLLHIKTWRVKSLSWLTWSQDLWLDSNPMVWLFVPQLQITQMFNF